jgi:hypothetical protein
MRRLPISIALVVALAGQFALAAPLHAASPYLLPVPAGTTVLVFQGNNSAFDHNAQNGSQDAWDFTVGATQFPVVAARGGTVIGARSDSTNTNCHSMACWTDANYVLIDHGADKTSALYLHLKTGSVAVKVGQTVAQGTFLGNADSTGFSYGTHLHFMVETTPTSRSGSHWWWTQSLGITFADAGLPLEDQSYTSKNATQATPTGLALDYAKLEAALKARGLKCEQKTDPFDGKPVELCSRSTSTSFEAAGLHVVNGWLVDLAVTAQPWAKKDADSVARSFLGYVAAAVSYPGATPDEASRWVVGHVGQVVAQAFGPAVFSMSVDPNLNSRAFNVQPAEPTQ